MRINMTNDENRRPMRKCPSEDHHIWAQEQTIRLYWTLHNKNTVLTPPSNYRRVTFDEEMIYVFSTDPPDSDAWLKSQTCGSRKRWKSARPQRSRQLNRIRSAAHRQRRLLHCYFTHLTRPIRLHQRGSSTLLSLRLDHGSDAEVRYTNPIGHVVRKRRGFRGGKSCGRMRSMTSTLCYLADPFSFVTAREANKRFNILSQRAQGHKSHFCTHNSNHWKQCLSNRDFYYLITIINFILILCYKLNSYTIAHPIYVACNNKTMHDSKQICSLAVVTHLTTPITLMNSNASAVTNQTVAELSIQTIHNYRFSQAAILSICKSLTFQLFCCQNTELRHAAQTSTVTFWNNSSDIQQRSWGWMLFQKTERDFIWAQPEPCSEPDNLDLR